jgi:hypothetical protein
VREAHVFIEEDSPALSNLTRFVSALYIATRKLDCAPGGPGGICFAVEREHLFERVMNNRGLAFEWGVVSNEGEASIIAYNC